MLTQTTDGKVEHQTSSGLQIVDVKGGDGIRKVLIDTNTRASFPMDETQWRELEMFVVTVLGLERN